MKNALVSVIITSYRGSLMINDAIDSALKQTYDNLEIIVVDDNGRGTEEQLKTEEKVQLYKDKIEYIVHDKNLNGAAARNTGIKCCHGEYIAFLDNDDLFLPNHIEKCVDKILKTKKDAVLCNVLFSNNNILYDYGIAETRDLAKKLLIKRAGLYTGSNLFLRTNCVRQIKGFDEQFTRLQDIEFMIRFLEKYSIVALQEFQIIKRHNGNMNVPCYEKHILINECFINKFKKQISELNDDEQKLFYKQLDIEMFNNAVFEGNNINIKNAYGKLHDKNAISWKIRIKYYSGIMGQGEKMSNLSFKMKRILKKKKLKSIYKELVENRLLMQNMGV
ncbi:glycosyltransferase family 2 protein [Lachnospiraceae bacterium SGI.085]